MNIILMLGVTACYMISSLSDKYAVSKKLNLTGSIICVIGVAAFQIL